MSSYPIYEFGKVNDGIYDEVSDLANTFERDDVSPEALSAIKKIVEKYNTLVEEKQELQDSLDELGNQVNDLEEQVYNLESDNTDLEEERDDFESERDELEHKLHEAQDTIATMLIASKKF